VALGKVITQAMQKHYNAVTISENEIDLSLSDMRIMACTRANYEAYRAATRAARGWEPPSWYDLLADKANLRPWVASTLATLKSWSAGQTGCYERAASGTGKFRRPGEGFPLPEAKPHETEVRSGSSADESRDHDKLSQATPLHVSLDKTRT